jgi:hypothetical protein
MMQAQLCCLGINDGRTFNVSDPPPNILRVPRMATPTLVIPTAIEDVQTPYDEYERDGTTANGLVRYVQVKHD